VNVARPASSSKLIVPISPAPADPAWAWLQELAADTSTTSRHTRRPWPSPHAKLQTSRCGGLCYA
jgi:hypothetical protein